MLCTAHSVCSLTSISRDWTNSYWFIIINILLVTKLILHPVMGYQALRKINYTFGYLFKITYFQFCMERDKYPYLFNKIKVDTGFSVGKILFLEDVISWLVRLWDMSSNRRKRILFNLLKIINQMFPAQFFTIHSRLKVKCPYIQGSVFLFLFLFYIYIL